MRRASDKRHQAHVPAAEVEGVSRYAAVPDGDRGSLVRSGRVIIPIESHAAASVALFLGVSNPPVGSLALLEHFQEHRVMRDNALPITTSCASLSIAVSRWLTPLSLRSLCLRALRELEHRVMAGGSAVGPGGSLTGTSGRVVSPADSTPIGREKLRGEFEFHRAVGNHVFEEFQSFMPLTGSLQEGDAGGAVSDANTPSLPPPSDYGASLRGRLRWPPGKGVP
jgi:hypothetical protein